MLSNIKGGCKVTIDEIKKLSLPEIQDIYCSYLKTKNLSSNTIQTARSDAFYLYRNDKTVDFWDLLTSHNFEELAYEHLCITLSKYSHGNVKSNISGYMYHIRQFRNFVYSDIDINMQIEKSKPSIPTHSKMFSKSIRQDIPTPTIEEVEKYLKLWDDLENYRLQESALNKLFLELVPTNTNILDILLKATTLNDFYSTNIFSIFPVAQHILSLNIDERLNAGDETLVDELKKVVINNKSKQFYSFATKYCSHHNPEDFPIYDSFVDKVLCYFREVDGFSKFENNELKNYMKFKCVLRDFQIFYGLQRYSFKELDKFLWQFGKNYFQKDYKNKKL